MNLSRENSRLYRLAPIAILLILLALLIAVISYSTADGFNMSRIVYRYAEQFRAGNGLVFNAGERVLLMSSPLYLLVLGALAALFPAADIPTLGLVIFVLSVVVGGIAIYWIARRANLSILASALAALLYILIWVLGLGMRAAYPAASMFTLLAFSFALNERWTVSGILLACAALSGPEAIILAFPLVMMASTKGRGLNFMAAFVLPLLIAVLVLRAYYGTFFWDGLLLPKEGSQPVNQWQWALPLTLGLALWVVALREANPVLNMCIAWIALHVFVIAGILRAESPGSFGIIAGPILLLVIVGARLTSPLRFAEALPLSANGEGEPRGTTIAAAGNGMPISISLLSIVILVVAVLLLHPTVDAQPSIIPPAQVRTIGITVPLSNVKVLPQQVIVAFDGQLQPELKAILERGDVQSALVRYAPDIIVIGNTGRLRARDLSSSTVARLGYHASQRSDVFERANPIGSFADVPITANFGPDIVLTSAALDQSALKPGQLLRVRLDWQFARSASQNVTIDLRLVSGNGDQFLLAHSTDTFDPSVFRAGTYSTYHTLAVVSNAWPGPVKLVVAVVINNGVAARIPISALAVSTP